MPKKLSPEAEAIAAYSSAMTAAFQLLVLSLERSNALERGQFQAMLRAPADDGYRVRDAKRIHFFETA